MKMKFPFLLTALAATLITQAQFIDVVNYRGAFAPAPQRQWTESWANFDPQNTTYPATTVTVSGSITANTTWTSGNVYLLQGVVYIDSLVTLTIQAGTIIRGDFNTANSSLLVRRGAKLNAEGTQCNPIVFTSNRATGQRSPGDWGGLIVLGRGVHNLGTNILIEGLSSSDPRNYHGGTDNNDNSGVIKYVRIEFGGFVFSANNEINGLTMGSVGRGTTIDFVQTSFINDDAFEWFGGAVNCKHLIAYRCVDDNFDTDNGFAGQLQYLLGIKDPQLADIVAGGSSEGFESDNEAGGTNPGIQPKTRAAFYNVTDIGPYRCPSPSPVPLSQLNRGARLRRNTDLKIFNSIFMNHKIGLFIDGALALANANEDSLVFRNNIIAGDFTTYPTNRVAEDAATRAILLNPAYQNDSINTCNLLVNAFDFINPDFRPNTSLTGNPTAAKVQGTPDLTPAIEIDNTLFTANQGYDFVVDLFENGVGTTSGQISFSLSTLPGFDITVPGLTLSGTNQSGANSNSNVSGGIPNNNGNWLFRISGSSIVVTSKPGVIINSSAPAIVGFRATRRATTPAGVNQTLTVSITDGSGLDNTPANNTASVVFTAN